MSLATLNTIAARHQERWGKVVDFRGKKIKCIVRSTPTVWPENASLWELSDEVAFIPISSLGSIPLQSERISINGVSRKIVSVNAGDIDYIVALKTFKTNT